MLIKKFIFGVFIIFFCINEQLYGQKHSIGGGVPYNVNSETLGLNIRAYYNIKEEICFGPEFIYFFPYTEIHDDDEIKITVWEFNFNAHYIFELNERLGIYPIIGLNFTHERENITNLINGDEVIENDNIFGFNVGGGFHIPLPKFTPFIEYEYVVGDLSEHVITIGVFFNIGQEEEHLKEKE